MSMNFSRAKIVIEFEDKSLLTFWVKDIKLEPPVLERECFYGLKNPQPTGIVKRTDGKFEAIITNNPDGKETSENVLLNERIKSGRDEGGWCGLPLPIISKGFEFTPREGGNEKIAPKCHPKCSCPECRSPMLPLVERAFKRAIEAVVDFVIWIW